MGPARGPLGLAPQSRPIAYGNLFAVSGAQQLRPSGAAVREAARGHNVIHWPWETRHGFRMTAATFGERPGKHPGWVLDSSRGEPPGGGLSRLHLGTGAHPAGSRPTMRPPPAGGSEGRRNGQLRTHGPGNSIAMSNSASTLGTCLVGAAAP